MDNIEETEKKDNFYHKSVGVPDISLPLSDISDLEPRLVLQRRNTVIYKNGSQTHKLDYIDVQTCKHQKKIPFCALELFSYE